MRYCLGIVAMVLYLAAAGFAQTEEGAPAPKRVKPTAGDIVSIEDGVLVVAVKEAGETRNQSFTLTDETKVKIDKADASVEQLSPGMRAAVTPGEGESVKQVAATRPKVTGTLVRLEGTTLYLSLGGRKRAQELEIAVAEDAAVKVDRKAAALADLRPGMKVTVPKVEEGTVTWVDARNPKEGEAGQGKTREKAPTAENGGESDTGGDSTPEPQ